MNEFLTKTEITYSMVDSGMHVTLLSLARIIEDATTKFLEDNNLSSKELNFTYGAIIVVLRNHITFLKRIHFRDIILSKVEVIRKASVAFLLKTSLYRYGEEEPSVTSIIELCAIDMKNRRLRNLEEFKPFNELKCYKRENTKALFQKFCPPNKDFLQKKVKVESTDIDYSNHLNNISYIRYFLNCFPSSFLKHLPYKDIEINYIKEAKEGTTCVISYLKENKDLFFLLKEKEDILTRAKITLS